MSLIRFLEKSLDAWFALLPQPKPACEIARNARLIAHRGAHNKKLQIIENTHAAFKRAQALQCWGIELDIHASKDGVLIVNHDPTLKRLWNKNATISECDYTTIELLAPQIPTLASVIAAYGKSMHLFIELKAPFYAVDELAEVLKPLNPCEDYHLLSLEQEIFSSLTHFPRESFLLVPVEHNVREFCNLSIQKGYGGVLGHYFLLSNSLINALRKEKQIAGVGFINSKYSLYRELNRGLTYLFTDDAGTVSHSLQQLCKA
ncbi:glycerophosphodiester phosphodiesterase [Legionella londiniensis]|uniref:Glycerophosphoryl diester phosphodiesterase n=1 Tax=Legionella londiniensis TaxID=45068 RepID=A0A0W0VJ73_9GAMM|nr:glycerophosphodiester phosphodiesterase family protein [Legionella londiniensis]KTD19817.1 glycerophosphoryl diester phosphodiesterase [Legionella londiniensis]STX92272.1 glycerophosphoryl diester phosphodiesterase [Legionella londiniensis]